MLHRLFIAFAFLLSACATVPAASQETGMVSAADRRAAEAGAEILREGGTAADAAFATMVALTVVEPQSSGIGGGGFLVYHDQASGRLTSFNGRAKGTLGVVPEPTTLVLLGAGVLGLTLAGRRRHA